MNPIRAEYEKWLETGHQISYEQWLEISLEVERDSHRWMIDQWKKRQTNIALERAEEQNTAKTLHKVQEILQANPPTE